MNLAFNGTIALLSVLSLVACGDDTSGAGGAGTGGSADGGGVAAATTTSTTTAAGTGGGAATGGAEGTGGSEGTGGAGICSGEGFEAVSQDAGEINDVFFYIALSDEETQADDLSFEIYSGIGTPGDVTVLDENYDVCDPCIRLRLGCDENLGNCDKVFLANTGTIAIESFEGTFSGELQGVELIEVTIDDENHSTPVVGGEVRCLDGYTFEAPIQE